ncbi:MAG: RHS repeat-associated core domain-containing protein [Rhizomicrobium sp.]
MASSSRSLLHPQRRGPSTRWSRAACNPCRRLTRVGVNGGAASCPTYGAYLKQTEAFASDGVTQIGPVATAYYDALGRVIAQDVQGYGGGASRTATVYDANGRVYETSRPYFVSGGTPRWTVDTYDDLGRLTRQDLPNGGYATVAYNGLTVSTANDQGQTTAVTRNAQGLNASVTDAASHATSYVYDAFGDPLTVTDPSGNVIANSFDIRGNKTASADPDMGSWSYVPDVLGEIRSQTDARSQTTTLSYDLLGRVLERNEAGSYTDWVYDGAVHGVGMVQASCTSASSNPSCASATTAKTFTYDGLGRPTGTTIAVGGTNYAYATAYNATNGAVDTVSYPSGLVVKDLYNAYGYLCRVTDNGGSHTCATGSDSHVLWTLSGADAELHPTVQTAGNAAFSTTQTYDANTGLLTNVRAGASDAVAAFDYGYDTLGNLTYRSDNHQGIFEKFCYDALNRLQYSATGSSGPASCTSGAITKSVGYDALGNITAKSDVGTYSYPGAGTAHPHAVSSIAGTVNGVTNPGYTYDADGNMTAGAGRTVTYTAFNMAASIVQGSTADCLTYDSDHARVAMAVYAGTACGGTLSSTTTYLNDPASGAMSEQLVAGGTTTWHDYLKVGGAILGERFYTVGGATSWKYFVLDHLGSVAVMTDDAGGVAERLSYDAWGRRRNSDGTDNAACSITSTTTRGYTGHEMLDSICEINANARIYDPTLGRFMSPDSTIPDPFNGQSFNRYSYVMNNPLSHYDPSGYAPQTRTVITNCEKDVCTGSKVPGGCGGCYIGFGAQFLAFTSGASGAGLGDAWTGSSTATGSSTSGVWVQTSETLVGTPIETVVVTCCFWVSFNYSFPTVQGSGGNETAGVDGGIFGVAGGATGHWPGHGATGHWEGEPPLENGGEGVLFNIGLAIATFGASIPEQIGIRGAEETGLETVTHFTSAAGAAAIGEGGTLNAGSFVTTSNLSGMSASQVEGALEIDAGKGAFSTTFQTPASNLGPAFNGPLTSGGAPQFQLVNPTQVTTFVPTP